MAGVGSQNVEMPAPVVSHSHLAASRESWRDIVRAATARGPSGCQKYYNMRLQDTEYRQFVVSLFTIAALSSN